MNLRVYVASAFANRPDVRLMHCAIAQFGAVATSSWAMVGGDHPESLTDAIAAEALATNDADIMRSHIMLVLGDPCSGETFAEARWAQTLGMPIVWTGRRVLSSYRPGVTYLESVDSCVALLRECAVRCELLPDDTRVARASLFGWLAQRNRPSTPGQQVAIEGTRAVLEALDGVGTTRRKGAA